MCVDLRTNSKDIMCLEEIRLHAPDLVTILDLIVNIVIAGTCMVIKNLTSYELDNSFELKKLQERWLRPGF